MATLRIKVCGLFMWVPDNQTMSLLLPTVHPHAPHVEKHVAAVLAPKVASAGQQTDFDRLDFGGATLSFPAAGGPGTVANHGLPMQNLALIRNVAGKGVKRKLLSGSLQGLTHARVTLLAGAYGNRCDADALFDYGGETKALAHVIWWEMPIAANSISISANGQTLTVPAGRVQTGYIDIELHYEPESHFPWGNHVPTDPAQSVGMKSHHFGAFYGLIPQPAATTLPVCRGAAQANLMQPTRGSDPVTCVHSYTDPDQ